VIGDERVPALFPEAPQQGVREGLVSCDVQRSRRPDSNRRPLHYEGGGLETTRPVSIACAGILSSGGTGGTGETGHSGCSVVPATFPEHPADDVVGYRAPEHCFACGHRLIPRDPSPYCRRCDSDRHDPLPHEDPLRV
jgi:hypothetical protein